MPITNSQIRATVRDILEANKATLLPIKYENKDFDPNGNPYAEFLLKPFNNDAVGPIGDIVGGIIGFNVYVFRDAGARYADDEAQRFVDLFPRGDFPGIDGLRIVTKGTIHDQVEGIHDREGSRFTPVTIHYEGESCP